MSLINQALKKAQSKHTSQENIQVPTPDPDQMETPLPSLHGSVKNRSRWYLIALLLAPAMTLPILSSKWHQEKRHYKEEIEILTKTPMSPVAKHNFRDTQDTTSTPTDQQLATDEVKYIEPIESSTRGSRFAANKSENPAVSKFINQSRISSVRAAGRNSKIVINNRTVPIDNYIDDDLPVRVSKIGTNEIVFTDDNGCEYHKHF